MKKNNKTANLRQGLKLSLVVTSVFAMLVSACTKSRDAEIKDGEMKSEIFEINGLDNKEFDLTTESTVVAAASEQKVNVLDEKPSVKISKTSAPEGLQKVFKGLIIKSDAGQTVKMKLALRLVNGGESALHVLKVVDDAAKLSELERQTIVAIGSGKDQKKAVPMFKVGVADYGQICREKDGNGDETSSLKLCHTDPESATHVQLSVIKNDRSTYMASDELKEVFLVSGIDRKVSTLAALKEKLNVSLSPADETKVVSIVSANQGSSSSILLYKILKKSDITDDKLLKKLDSNVRLGEIGYCPKDVLAQLSAADQKDCVIVLAYELGATAVSARVKTQDELAQATIAIDFKSADADGAQLLKIEAKKPVQTIMVTDINSLNPYNTIRMTDIKDKEFLLRRTFEDGAASIQVYGPGASGAVDIVKFEFEDRRLVVRRATAVNGMKDPDQIDREELMSIPVRYLGIDPNSSKLNPKLIDVNKDTAGYVLLNWTNNTLPTINSPLAYFQDGACFNGTGSQTVTDLDNRIVDGVLNFSINGSYSFSPECMSQYQMNDYWYGAGLQGVFNIKERVSFKLHTGDLDKKAIELPFQAQNLMGFGTFTAGQIKPDEFGNQGRIGTQDSNPVIHDFSGGKQLVYSLGGLPANGWVREALITGTQEVVAEWNAGLHLAFKGTELDRSGDFVVLKIDGVDQSEGRLGDLDRNYIWNYQKNLDSGLLGMSQAAPNPRSGRIEQNNILMYSGNLLSNIGYVKEMARLQKDYADMKAKILAEADKDSGKVEQPIDETPVIDPNDPNGGLIIENGKRIHNLNPKARSQVFKAANAFIEQINHLATVNVPKTPIAMKKSAAASVKAKATSSLTAMKNDFTANGGARDRGNSEKQQASKQITEKAYLARIFQKAIEMNATRDESTLNALSAAEILKSYGNRLSASQKATLAAQSRRLALMAEFEKNFRKGPNCAIVASAASLSGIDIDPDLLDDSKNPEVFKSWYKSTLLHEMGHSLGLTHNFAGSTDKANFKFKKELNDAKMDRNYSSIMDYIPDQLMKYHGPGTYDVRTLRAAYTGLVEVHPDLKQFLNKEGNRLVIPQTQVDIAIQKQASNEQFQMEVKIEDLRKALLGDKTLWSLDARALSRLPLKPYNFCTDVHVGGDPSCNRWDLGTNNLEIAQFYINEYQNLYPVLNSKGRKMTMRSFGSYIGRVYMQFFGIRPMVDETFYLAVGGQPQEVWLPSALGALEGLKFFSSVVNTPTAALPFSSMDRFQVYDNPVFDEQGQPVANPDGTQKTEKILVESKSNQDLAVPGMPEQIDTRGIEFDKAIALMMMSQKGFGNPRYESMSLRISYADFEKYLLGAEANNSITLQTIKGILADNPNAMTLTGKGGMVMLPGSFQTQATEIVKYYAVLSAGVLMDADTLEDKFNFAALFRTGSSQKSVPKDRFAVTKLDQPLTSQTSLKLWSMDNASISGELVRSAAQKRALIDNADKLVPALTTLYKAAKAQDEAKIKPAKEALIGMLQSMNRNGLLINKQEATQVNFDQVADLMVNFMGQNEQLAEQVIQLVTSGQIPAELVGSLLQGSANEIESLTKALPYVGISTKALLALYADKSGKAGAGSPDQSADQSADQSGDKAKQGAGDVAQDPSEQIKAQVFSMYLKEDLLETNHGMVVNNLGFLNKILYMMNPELNRFN